MKIAAGNYLDRSTGAVYVAVGDGKIYFHSNQIVAVVVGGVLYRQKEMSGGIVYKRVRQAVSQSEASRVSLVTRKELNDLAVSVVMTEASAEMDRRLLNKEN